MGTRKIVMDTSVLVAGMIGHCASRVILNMIIDCGIIPIICREILQEYIRVIHYPKITSRYLLAKYTQ